MRRPLKTKRFTGGKEPEPEDVRETTTMPTQELLGWLLQAADLPSSSEIRAVERVPVVGFWHISALNHFWEEIVREEMFSLVDSRLLYRLDALYYNFFRCNLAGDALNHSSMQHP